MENIRHCVSIEFKYIKLFSHFDWLILAYDLLADRCTIDVIIITKFFPLCFKMAEGFENLDNNYFT